MNIFSKSLATIAKIVLAFALVWATFLIFFVKSKAEFYFGISLLVLITLPTIFVVYFKTNKIFRIIYIIILTLFAIGVIVGFNRYIQKDKTQKAIEFISAQKINLDDAMGKNLPPVPDQKLNDSTIAGIDANKNGIRDDVELAIFKEYPNSAKIRAAELQYAQALQLELTQVFNSETLVAVMKKEDLVSFCISDFVGVNALIGKEKEVEGFILNNSLRKQRQIDIYKKYMIGYALPSGNGCDVDTSLLQN